MFEYKCEKCNNIWYVNDNVKKNVKVCPFCIQQVPKKEFVIVVDCFQNAVKKVIYELGVDSLKDRNRFLGYLSDIAPDYRKEIHILTKNCDDVVFAKFYNLSKESLENPKHEFKKIEYNLTHEDGVAEQWAALICESFYSAMFVDEENIGEETCTDSKVVEEISSVPTQNIEVKIGDIINFGKNYKWKIIDIDSSGVLLLCENFEKEVQFHDKKEKVSWGSCSLRKWLNDDFIREEFSMVEMKNLVVSINDDEKNPLGFSISELCDTVEDNVFIFSEDDYKKYKHLIEYSDKAWMLRTPSVTNGQGFVSTCEKNKISSWGVRINYPTSIKPALRVKLDCFKIKI